MTYPSHSIHYRPEIDGLRAFALVVVIINHFDKHVLPGGYLGVDMFCDFRLCNYIVNLLKRSRDFKDFISGFYERRVKRLVPSLAIFVLLSSIAICLFSHSPDSSLRTGLSSLFGLSNLYLLYESTDYFLIPLILMYLLIHGLWQWEEQFYFCFQLSFGFLDLIAILQTVLVIYS